VRERLNFKIAIALALANIAKSIDHTSKMILALGYQPSSMFFSRIML
jgi:hypothetical protein